jgi:hypothetical protein
VLEKWSVGVMQNRRTNSRPTSTPTLQHSITPIAFGVIKEL